MKKLKEKYEIGDIVVIYRCDMFKRIIKERGYTGEIVNVYDNHILVKFKNYCESFSYIDIDKKFVEVEIIKRIKNLAG